MDHDVVAYRVKEIQTAMKQPPSRANARRVLLLTLALREDVRDIPERLKKGEDLILRTGGAMYLMQFHDKLRLDYKNAKELIDEVEREVDTVTAAKLIFDAEEVKDGNTGRLPLSGDRTFHQSYEGGHRVQQSGGVQAGPGHRPGRSDHGPSGVPADAETGTKRPRPRFAATGYDLV